MPAPLRKVAAVVPIKTAKARRLRGHLVGSVVGRDERGPLVDYPGNPHGPLTARTAVAFAPPVAEGDRARPEVLLVFDEERSDRPVIVALLDPAGVEVTVDGRRAVLTAKDEIVLQCGEASITLRRNGRVIIRGAYVETRSRGVNRIKGGTVQIN
ncbi:MAG TPA: DUF6484 domain-containing protein [Polyangiaceae bacterium]|nr:DUF6484 domain-containing protein [Polyangiaceae bacterium]